MLFSLKLRLFSSIIKYHNVVGSTFCTKLSFSYFFSFSGKFKFAILKENFPPVAFFTRFNFELSEFYNFSLWNVWKFLLKKKRTHGRQDEICRAIFKAKISYPHHKCVGVSKLSVLLSDDHRSQKKSKREKRGNFNE